jgi:hypothetical protein
MAQRPWGGGWTARRRLGIGCRESAGSSGDGPIRKPIGNPSWPTAKSQRGADLAISGVILSASTSAAVRPHRRDPERGRRPWTTRLRQG